jgi:hypothetical protein
MFMLNVFNLPSFTNYRSIGVATSQAHYDFELSYVCKWDVMLTTHLHLELRLRMISGYNSASLLACNGVTFTFAYDEGRNIKESHFETSFFIFFLDRI